jgi:hypothetical protein
LQTMPVVIRINITALQVSYVREWFEWHKTSERDGLFLEISQPPISLCKMSLLQGRPFRNKLVEGVDCVGERDAVNFVDFIGHQQNALGSRSRRKNERGIAASSDNSPKRWNPRTRIGSER